MSATNLSQIVRQKIKNLSWMFFDVDGILTDGSLFFSDKGETLKKFNVLDGHGIKQLFNYGIDVGLISSRDHLATRLRAQELGISVLMLQVESKLDAFEEWLKDVNVDPARCGHMGDDIPDLELFEKVGFSATVPNACEEIKNAADFITVKQGGNGAVREICDLIIKVNE